MTVEERVDRIEALLLSLFDYLPLSFKLAMPSKILKVFEELDKEEQEP